MELQQGFGINGMGQRDPFAARQFLAAHVRFGSWPFQNVLPLEVGTRRSGGVS